MRYNVVDNYAHFMPCQDPAITISQHLLVRSQVSTGAARRSSTVRAMAIDSRFETIVCVALVAWLAGVRLHRISIDTQQIPSALDMVLEGNIEMSSHAF